MQRPWARLTMAEAIEKYGNISQDEIADYEKAKAAAEKLHIQVDSSWGHGKIISEIFEITAEEKLINPAFIIDYPKEISPLSKSKESNPELTDRFELFLSVPFSFILNLTYILSNMDNGLRKEISTLI